MIRWTVGLPLMFAVTIMQVAIFDSALIGNQIRLDLPLYLLVAIGLSVRGEQATLGGFALGLIVDMFQFGPFGVNALIFCLAGWSLAEARLRVLQENASFRTMQGVLSTLVVTGLTWLLGSVFGQSPLGLNNGPWGVVANLAAVGLIGGIMVHPMGRLVRWMLRKEWVDRATPAVGI